MKRVLARFRPASLRWRLLRLVTVATVLVWILAGVLSYRQAERELRELLDAQMDKTARMLLAQAQFDERQLSSLFVNMTALRGPHVHRDELPVEFRIVRTNGTLLVSSKNAPPMGDAAVPTSGFAEPLIDARSWRSLVVSTASGDYRIQVLQSMRQRDHLVLEIASQAVIPLFVLFPLLMALIYISVRRGLEPLDQLAGDVATRSLDNLAEVTGHAVPLEARPLVEAINDLLGRLARTLENERRFTADAAHELRTPLAVVKVQAQVALGSTLISDREHALRQVVAGTDRATHLVEQLLRMARLDPLTQLPDAHPVDLAEVARQVVTRMYEASPDLACRIQLEAADAPLRLNADAELLAAALRNLLDNALRYTPAGSPVQLMAGLDQNDLVLSVSDAGDGVPAEDLPRLTERFYRAGGANDSSGTSVAGSGLGLAIVQRIAQLHGARLELVNGPRGGFEARLRWTGWISS